jgi:hypothetical protein
MDHTNLTAAEWHLVNANTHAITNPLFTLIGVSILTVFPDLMHVKHLGTDMHIYGSVLWLLVYQVTTAGQAEENLKEVWSIVNEFYKAHHVPTRFQIIKLSMFTNAKSPGKFAPKLKGKAAELRHLGEPLLQVWRMNMDKNNTRHVQVCLLLEHNIRMEHILDEHPTEAALPPAAASSFRKSTFYLLALLTTLSQYFSANNIALFHITIKAHYLVHIALRAHEVSPKQSWCYCGEDFMQKMGKLISSCCKGRHPSDVIMKVSRKYLRAIHCQLRSRD